MLFNVSVIINYKNQLSVRRIFIPYFGETLALSTALIWATAVILFKKSGESVHPIALNLFKNTLALFLFIPTIYLFGYKLNHDAPMQDYYLLMISGALGIGIADTFFFKSLNLLGAGMTAIVDCLYSPFIIILSILWLGERLAFWQVVGVILIVSAVLTATRGGKSISRRDLAWGVGYGVLAMGFMAVGIVMIKPILDRSPLLWVTEIRLVGGAVVLFLMLVFNRNRRNIILSLNTPGSWRFTLPGSFIGAYLALVFWLGGMKYTQMSIASALNQTSVIFMFIFAAIFLHERLDWKMTIGIVLGAIGVFLVTFA